MGKKPGVKSSWGTSQDGVLMATMRSARTTTSKVPTESRTSV